MPLPYNSEKIDNVEDSKALYKTSSMVSINDDTMSQQQNNKVKVLNYVWWITSPRPMGYHLTIHSASLSITLINKLNMFSM